MKRKSLVAVVIPIYKETLTHYETISLSQCLKILKIHTIIFIAPIGLNTTVYEQFCAQKIAFKIKYLDKILFKDINGYNSLMLSAHFYRTFLKYKFILIYQLDAFVFKDDLVFWCNQNYDFIGAPHLPHPNLPGEIQFLKNYTQILRIISKTFKTNHRISNVGNGGFSLRKTRSCYWLVKLLNNRVKSWGNNNEDGFFKYWGNLLYPFFKLPMDETALQFAIEVSPKESLNKIKNVPFGCHAFEKYDWEAWKPHILKGEHGSPH